MNRHRCAAFTIALLAAATQCYAQASSALGSLGWYADPEAHIFAGQWWVYPTSSLTTGDVRSSSSTSNLTPEQQQLRAGKLVMRDYLLQTSLDALSSTDLVHWTRHADVLSVRDVKWAAYAVWAPTVISLNSRYYLLFAANDVQKNSTFAGGIGVGVSDSPAGPFQDALGKPLIGAFHNGAQPIDPMIFRDGDGSIFLYYGGQGHCNVVQLSDDLTHVVPMADGSLYREITPENYVEGPFMLKRKGVYYLMWSEGDWGDASYGVAYAKGSSPVGPFVRAGKILASDPAIATGPGHHSVVQVPGTDEWYIFYHRHPLGTSGANRRVVAVDRLSFRRQWRHPYGSANGSGSREAHTRGFKSRPTAMRRRNQESPVTRTHHGAPRRRSYACSGFLERRCIAAAVKDVL